MPKINMDYSNTIIYKIVCKDVNIKECYVGQTTNFTKRKCKHKSDCNNINDRNYNLYIYKFIRENGNWNNWDMIEIEKYNATDKLDACKKERHWIEQLHATLNKQLPTRTEKEYLVDNKDKIIEYHKKYYIENINKFNERSKEYWIDNKDRLKELNKEYRINNKDKLKEKDKERNRKYYINNKDKHKEHMKQYTNQKRIQQKELKLMANEDI